MYLTGENTITMIAAILDVMPLDDAPGTPVSDSCLICNSNVVMVICVRVILDILKKNKQKKTTLSRKHEMVVKRVFTKLYTLPKTCF